MSGFEFCSHRVHGRRQTPRSTCHNSPAGRAVLWAFRAESAQEIDDKAYRQNQAQAAAADDGTAKVKPAATEQEK